MKNTLRVLAFVLCIAMLFTMVACKNTENKEEKPKDNNGQTQNAGDDFAGSDLSDGDFVIDNLEDDSLQQIIFARPITEGYISSGVKISLDADGEADDDLDIGIDEDDFELGDIEDDEYNYQPLIQKLGASVSGNKRTININNSEKGVLYKGFTGVSCNVFPTQTSLYSQTIAGDAEAYLELNGKRFNDVSPKYARAWFQIDWIITQESGNHTDDLSWKKYKENDNWEENPDYINYYNRVYCFSDGQTMNDEFNAFVDYCTMLDEANIDIYLAFGWKVASRIESWFGADPIQGRTSAPLDLDAYADAAVALYKYMREDVGLDNFNVLSFYNEPNRTNDHIFYAESDFATIGDKGVYWASMARKCREALKKAGMSDVKIMGADLSGDIDVSADNYVNPYLRNHAKNVVDTYTFHYYGYYSEGYEELFDKLVFVSNFYNKPTMITEMFTAEKDIQSEAAFKWKDWDRSIASVYIACANNGVLGAFRWVYVGGALPDPIGYDLENGDKALWIRPTSVETANEVHHAFYEDSMLNQYVPKNANVHKIDWVGEDLRTSAFTSEDGKDFALVIEANEFDENRNLKVNLTESLEGKTLYVYRYTHQQKINGNATVPASVKTIKNVYKHFEFDISYRYGLYVISTIKPLKQVALFDKSSAPTTAVNCKINGSVKVNAELIDCNDDDELIWEIKRYSGAVKTKKKKELRRENCIETGSYLEKGSITKISSDTLTMTYTATDKAEVGEVIAIRCTVKDGDTNVKNDRYAVLMIVIN